MCPDLLSVYSIPIVGQLAFATRSNQLYAAIGKIELKFLQDECNYMRSVTFLAETIEKAFGGAVLQTIAALFALFLTQYATLAIVSLSLILVYDIVLIRGSIKNDDLIKQCGNRSLNTLQNFIDGFLKLSFGGRLAKVDLKQKLDSKEISFMSKTLREDLLPSVRDYARFFLTSIRVDSKGNSPLALRKRRVVKLQELADKVDESLNALQASLKEDQSLYETASKQFQESVAVLATANNRLCEGLYSR